MSNTARRLLEKWSSAKISRLLALRDSGAAVMEGAFDGIYYQNPSLATGGPAFAKWEKAAAANPKASEEILAMLVELKDLVKAAQLERDAEKVEKEARKAARATKAANVTSNGVQLHKLSPAAFESLSTMLAPVRAQYAERAEVLAQEFVARVKTKLADAGGDAKKAFPKPERYNQFDPYTAYRAFVTYPDTKVATITYATVAKFVAHQRRNAQAEVDAYIIKLALKIGKAVVALTVRGDLWNGSTLNVTCADGEAQTWHTRCILNCSCLGKVFNQWPTRRE